MDPYPLIIVISILVALLQVAVVVIVVTALAKSYKLLKRVAQNTDSSREFLREPSANEMPRDPR